MHPTSVFVEYAYLGEAGVDDQVQETAEHFVSHEDSDVEVSHYDGTRVPLAVLPDAPCC